MASMPLSDGRNRKGEDRKTTLACQKSHLGSRAARLKIAEESPVLTIYGSLSLVQSSPFLAIGATQKTEASPTAALGAEAIRLSSPRSKNEPA